MGYKGNSVHGEIPESGAIFMSNIETKEECLERKLFGLPSGLSNFVLHVRKGMTLFLFEFERRLLYGVFRATCDGGMNLEPKAFRSLGKHFPAQVRFTTVWDCIPLAEHEFQGVIKDNYFSKKKFHFGLNKKQVSKLMKLFRSKSSSKNHPEKNIWRYDDIPDEGNPRASDHRKDIRHRIRFDSSDFRGDEVKEVDDDMYINRHISRRKDEREEFLTHYMAESDEFGDCGRNDIHGKHHDLRGKVIEDGYTSIFSKHHGKHLDEIGDCGRNDVLGKHHDLREKSVEDGYMPVFSKHHGKHLDEIGVCGRNDVLGKHHDLRGKVIEDGYTSIFSKHHGKHLDEIGDCGRNNVLGKHHDLREKIIEDGYTPVFSKHHGKHLDEIGVCGRDDELGKHHDLREKIIEDGYTPVLSKHHGKHCDEIGVCGRDDVLGKHHDLREKIIEDCYMPVFSKHHGKHLDEIGDCDRNDILGKHHDLREKSVEDGYMPVFSKHHGKHLDEIGDCGRNDILGKHHDLREKSVEDGYTPVFSKYYGKHFDEIGVGNSDFMMDGENKDIIEYNRLQDEYKFREGFWKSVNERPLTNHVFSSFNQNAYSNCDPTRIDVPDIQLSPCFDEGSSFIPIANNFRFYPSPEKISKSKLLPYYSHDEGSIGYLDDPGSQSCIYPKFISRKLSSSDALLSVHEVNSTDNDERSREKHEKMSTIGTTNKRGSVFSRLTSNAKQEQAFETNEKDGLNASVDKVMQMLEKVVSNPIKKTGKSIPVIKQEPDNPPDSKIEDYKFPDVNLEVDAGVEYEEVEGESVLRETRLVDFKRRKRSNKRIDGTPKESSECLVGATSDVAPFGTDQLTAMPSKRRKLIRPAFVEQKLISDGVSDLENALPENNTVSTKVVETSEKVENTLSENNSVSTIAVPASLENTTDDSNSTKTVLESSKKIDASTKLIDLNMMPTSDESSPSKDDNNTSNLLESLHMSTAECQKSCKEGEENAGGDCLVSDVCVEATPVALPKNDQKMCGWIEW